MDIIQVENKHLSEIRKKILEKQENKCILCERTVTKDMVMCVDHCHKTGRIRAVLCLNCNAMAGKIEQRINRAKQKLTIMQWLDNFVKYIKSDHTEYLHPKAKPKQIIKKSIFNKLQKMYKLKYPKKKLLQYPKSGKPTKQIIQLLKEFDVQG